MRRSLLLLLGLTLGWVSAMGSNFTLKTGYANVDPVYASALNTSSILGNSTVFGKFLNLNFLAAPNATGFVNDGDCGASFNVDGSLALCNGQLTWNVPNAAPGYSILTDSLKFVYEPGVGETVLFTGAAVPAGSHTTTLGLGTYQVRYAVRENVANPNSDTLYCFITFEVLDPIAPELTYTADTLIRVTTAGLCYRLPARGGVNNLLSTVGATDNCTATGDLELTVSITDASNNVIYQDTSKTGGVVNPFSAGITKINWTVDSIVNVQFPIGANKILVSVSDASGNVSSIDSLLLVVEDQELPVWDSPYDVASADTVKTTLDDSEMLCGWRGGLAVFPTATDNCDPSVQVTFAIYDGATLVDTSSSGVDISNYVFPVGTTTIVFYAVDSHGNAAASNYSINIVVTDADAPTVTNVNDFDFGPYATSNNGTGDCTSRIQIPVLSANDYCDSGTDLTYEYRIDGGAWEATATGAIDTVLAADTILFEYRITDLEGNISDTVSFKVVVFDDELPTADLTVDSYVLYPQLTCDTLTTIESPTTNDNCEILPTEWKRVYLGVAIDSGVGNIGALAYNFGTYTILWTVADTAGNAIDLVSTVTVADTLAPIVDDINETSGIAGNGTFATPYTIFTSDSVGCNPSLTLSFDATDNCSVKKLSNSYNSSVYNTTGFAQPIDSLFTFANLPVNYTDTTIIFIYAEDTVGNVGISDTIYVLVLDDELPNILATGVNDTIVGNNIGLCSKELTYNALTSFGANDTCGIDSIIVRVTPGIVNATDTIYNGSVTNSNFTYTFSSGITTVDYTAKDLAGNVSATNSFTVTVEDLEKPQIFYNDTITVALAASVCSQTNVTVLIEADDVEDNCSVDDSLLIKRTNVRVLDGHPNGITNSRTPNGRDASGLYNLGETTVTFTIWDDAGNMASKTVLVRVIDITGPAFASLPTIVRFADINQCQAQFKLQIPASTDACGIDTIKYSINGVTKVLTPTQITNGFTAAEVFQKDTTIVTWTIVDGSGLSTSGAQKVVVNDSQAPVIPALPNLAFTNDAGVCTSNQTLTLPVATDNCEIDSLFFVIDGTKFGNNQSATFAFTAGTTVVSVIAKDATGNADTTMFDVVVTDTEAPVIACPSTTLAIEETGGCTADFILRSLVAVTDNCSDSASIAMTAKAVNNATSAVSSFNANLTTTLSFGTYTVTTIATDAAGKKDTCVFQLDVFSNVAPTVTGFPADRTVYTLANECSRIVNWVEPTAVSACAGPITPTRTAVPGTEFPLGVTNVIYNFGSYSDTLVITVLDTAKPVITNMPSVLNLALGNGCEVTANYNVDVQDNCDAQGLTVTYTYAPGTLLGVGTYTNTVTVTDASGNSTSGSFVINIVDNIKPTITASVASITVCVGSSLNYTVAANDNCSYTLTYSNPALQPGSNPTVTANEVVTITATDPSGNFNTVNVSVVVLPAATPADAGADQVVTDANATLAGNLPGTGENGSWTVVGGTGVFSNNTITNPVVTGLSEGVNIYRYTISNSTCGSTTDDVTITYEISANIGENTPTVFTPNGDGTNDVWNIPGIGSYPNAIVKVYSRWGNLVFESEAGYTTPWDGTFEGSDLPVASYYYVIDLGDGSDALSGVISIIR